MPRLELEQFLDGGIVREESFRASVAGHDWSQYQGKTLFVRGCGATPIPMWAYMMVAAHATRAGAKQLLYGEEQSPILVFQQQG